MSLSIIGDEDVSTNEQIELEDDSFIDIEQTVNTVVSEKLDLERIIDCVFNINE